MKYSRFISLGLLLVLQQSVWAGPRTYRQALAIAEKQAAKMGVTISQQAKARAFSDAPSATSCQAASYYVFPYGDNNGFAIVSGNDQMPELVAYSDRGSLDENNMSEGCRDFLQAYKLLTEAVARGDKEALRLVAEKQRLLAEADNQHPVVAPLLGDIHWYQDAPYNDLCPYNETVQKRCYTGCVATAMAQVMMYWKWPKTLQEDISGYVSNMAGEGYDMPQIMKGATYDWDKMLPAYTDGHYTAEQAEAVAKLMYHCGAATKMMYSTQGSGASIKPSVLVYNFGYDPSIIRQVLRECFSLKDWCQMIDGELEAKRPILYAGNCSKGGHEFVCDGADGKGLYHINWGWAGRGDGYFDITILNPNDRGIGAGEGINGFNSNCSMIIGVQPDNGEPAVAPSLDGGDVGVASEGRSFGSNIFSRASVSDPFKISYTTSYYNMVDKDFEGMVSVGIKNADGEYVPISEGVSIEMDASADISFEPAGTEEEISHKIEYAFPVGNTILYDIYSTDDGETWLPCVYEYGIHAQGVLATETTLTLVNDSYDLKATIKADANLVANQDCQFSYTMTNGNAYDYLGSVWVYVSASQEMPAEPSYKDYVDIAAGGSTTHTITLKPTQAGDCYVWVYDKDNDEVLVAAQKFTVAADPSTGISTAVAALGSMRVSTAKGMLSIASEQAQPVGIYNMAGQCVRRINLQAGVTANLSLPSGVYMVGKEKVMVK